jgi:hypothetical protein
VQCSLEEFIERWSPHVPERYRLAVRCFGLLGSRVAIQQTFDALFSILGQERNPRPKPPRWIVSIKRDFRTGPLMDLEDWRSKLRKNLRACPSIWLSVVTDSRFGTTQLKVSSFE